MQPRHYVSASFLFRKQQNCECNLPWIELGKFSPFDSDMLTPFYAKGYKYLDFSSISLVGWALLLCLLPVSPRCCTGSAQSGFLGLSEGRNGCAPCIVAVCCDCQCQPCLRALRQRNSDGFSPSTSAPSPVKHGFYELLPVQSVEMKLI